jgi:hypothetical protein
MVEGPKTWTRGPDVGPNRFPIAVWLQSPRNAAKYKAIGINTYVGLWEGPTGEQIAELKRQGMVVFCGQNDYALKHLDEKTIVGWLQEDEPDNAQSLGEGKGYGPPILPERIVERYRKMRAADPTRPVLLNLGQGVAWDGWYGRGVRTNHPEDYPQYARGGDIVSFDIYPAVHDRPAVAGKLWYVALGVHRLRDWAGDRPVWDCIECTRISNAKVRPTPEQVKAEVWMSIVHGSRGLIYFCHEFSPRFVEAGLLADAEMARAVKAINAQVQELAPVIHGPPQSGLVTLKTEPAASSAELARLLPGPPIRMTVRKHEGAVYVIAVNLESAPALGRFQADGLRDQGKVEVLGEDRAIDVKDGQFQDRFAPNAVHLYRMK